MDNALYVMLAKEMGLFRQMDVVANNLANSETTGYKNKDVIFEDYLIKEQKPRSLDFPYDVATALDMRPGALRTTGRPLDLALGGEGFFRVMTPGGERYTRAGDFAINPAGELVTSLGYQVLNNGGAAISLDVTAGDVKITQAGRIIVNGEAVDQISLVNFDNPRKLVPTGDTLFAIGQATMLEGENNNIRVFQGVLEDANVNKVKELMHAIEVQRGTSTTVNYINALDNLQKALVKNILKIEV